MKRQSCFCLFVAVLVGLSLNTLRAQGKEQIELFGYFESQIMGANLQNTNNNYNFIQMYTNKLRVDLKADLADNVTFAANFNYITYHGKTQWDILDFLSPQVRAETPLGIEDFYKLIFNDRHYLDNAYLRITYRGLDLTLGKQQLSLGTGYAWNPTDVFNTKDLLDPTYEQPGHNAMRLDAVLGKIGNLTLLYAPEEGWRDSAKMIQLKTRVSHFDLSLLAVEKTWFFHDYLQFDPQGADFRLIPETRRLWGGSTAGELLGLGLWAEFGYNSMQSSQDFQELVVGGDYTFDNQTYVMWEFYHNTQGRSDFSEYTLNDWMRLLTAEQKSIARDQLYTFIQHPVTDLLRVGFSGIYCLSDGSIALVPALNWSFSDNVEVLAYLNIYAGKEGTVYSPSLGNGGLLRVRVYF